MGAHPSDRRLHLDRVKPGRAISAAARGSFYVPASGGLACMCGRPLGCKSFDENFDGRIDCEHVSGLLTRHTVRWPRWNPRSSPKQFCGFESRHANRVLWIIGSTDRHLIQLFHPGINARFRRQPANAAPATRVIATHAAWAILLLNRA